MFHQTGSFGDFRFVRKPGVNFTNILRAAFRVCNFLAKEENELKTAR